MAAPWLELEAEFEATHKPVLDLLLRKAALSEGQTILDIGPGSGQSLLAAADIVGPSGKVTGVEIAPPFVDRARMRTPENVEVVAADAASYTYENSGYDAAISLFGTMFFDDPIAAFNNIRSAMKPSAVLTFACWGPPTANPWFSLPGRVATEVLGPGPKFDADVPGPMSFSDPAKISRILAEAGWSWEIDTEELFLTPLGSPNDVATAQTKVGAAIKRMQMANDEGILTDSHRHSIYQGLVSEFSKMATSGSVRVPAMVHFVRATA